MSSAQAPAENRGASPLVGSDASGSLPGSSALRLAAAWDAAAEAREEEALDARMEGHIDQAIPLENAANAYRRCIQMLRAELARANERQPEENVRG